MTDEEALDAQLAEIDARIEELEEEVREYEAALWFRDLLYLRDEGFIEIEDERLYLSEGACSVN